MNIYNAIEKTIVYGATLFVGFLALVMIVGIVTQVVLAILIVTNTI